MDFVRTVTVERAEKQSESVYEFPMTLATEGEASDGHILSIKGGSVPERMPLLVAHMNHPGSLAGSVVSAQKRLRSQPAELRAIGRIELEGEGEAVSIRRDLAHMIERGHLSSVSIRWQTKKATPRRDLPKRHPAYVEADDDDMSRRYGLFIEEWEALEGSVVPIGADPEAQIGRSGAWLPFFDHTDPDPAPPLFQARNLIALGLDLVDELQIPPEDVLRGIVDHFDGFRLETDAAPLKQRDEEGSDEPLEQPTAPEPDAPLKQRVERFSTEDLRDLLERHESRMVQRTAAVVANAIRGRRRS